MKSSFDVSNNKTKAGVYAPEYYKKFKCTADKCRHSCCIDWEICIDEKTLEKYKNHPDIMVTIEQTDDCPCFVLSQDGRCPHLNSFGLCDIIISHGDDYLCEICSNHPRFFNRVGYGKIEAGLGIVCEQACKMVMENEKPFSLSLVEELDECCEYEMQFEPLLIRDRIIADIEAEGSFFDKVMSLQKQFKISDLHTMEEWIDRYLHLETLDESWKRSLEEARGRVLCDDKIEYDKYYKRLLTYFVYRHVSVSESENDLCARLAFAILSVKMIKLLFEGDKVQNLEGLIDIARRYSAEIEYSEENTYELIFELGFGILQKND